MGLPLPCRSLTCLPCRPEFKERPPGHQGRTRPAFRELRHLPLRPSCSHHPEGLPRLAGRCGCAELPLPAILRTSGNAAVCAGFHVDARSMLHAGLAMGSDILWAFSSSWPSSGLAGIPRHAWGTAAGRAQFRGRPGVANPALRSGRWPCASLQSAPLTAFPNLSIFAGMHRRNSLFRMAALFLAVLMCIVWAIPAGAMTCCPMMGEGIRGTVSAPPSHEDAHACCNGARSEDASLPGNGDEADQQAPAGKCPMMRCGIAHVLALLPGPDVPAPLPLRKVNVVAESLSVPIAHIAVPFRPPRPLHPAC